jgi:hypothetical protein
MLEGMEKYWKPIDHEGEVFLEAAVRRTGLSPITIKRHTKNQKLLESGIIPEEYYESIEQAGEKSLVQIANLIERDFELDKKDWRKLAEASGDERKVGEIVRKIKGVLPRSNYLAITMDKDGNLVAHTSEEHIEFGKLYLSDNPVVKRAIDRITGCAGILDKVNY